MSDHMFELCGARLVARGDGTLFWPAVGMLVVADLHLGRAERMARRGTGLLPPYDTADTLDRLETALRATDPARVVCLGDSFDDLRAARALDRVVVDRIARLAAGRSWVWIAGNHDPGPVDLPGTHRGQLRAGGLVFRHIAEADARGEVSGHYHPKMRLVLRGQTIARPCFLASDRRLIMPAFGTYTGGLDIRDAVFDPLFGPDARAFLLGRRVTVLPRRPDIAA